MEKLLSLLSEIRPDVDFEVEKNLIEDGILDSFDIVSIISELDENFGIAVRVTELGPENFNSADAIFEMVKRLKE
jgi:D-alanine--poly(phosphoribitol) ligase subunit 2